MVQVFVKGLNSKTSVLNLEDNYTISSKELIVKCLKAIFEKEEKSFQDLINNNKINFINNLYSKSSCNINIYSKSSCKIIRYNTETTYFNTSQFNDCTLDMIVANGVIKEISPVDKENIQNILNGYY